MNKEKKDRSSFVIVGLLVLAVILGIAIFFQNKPSSVSRSNSGDVAKSTKSQGKSFKNIPRRPTPIGLTADEKKILTPPNGDASKSDKDAYLKFISALAKKTDVLDLNNCVKPSPLVMQLAPNQNFKITNSDKVDHTIYLYNDHSFKVPAGKTISAKADFIKNGYVAYRCDDKSGVVGDFLIKQ